MIIKKYKALTEKEAILLAKEDLGPDAIVMNVKKIKPGTGEAFDWELLREAKIVAGDTAEGELFGKPYFLAGGLHAGNLREAAALGSYGLDVSSGIETDGSKDFTKMVEVMELVRKF